MVGRQLLEDRIHPWCSKSHRCCFLLECFRRRDKSFGAGGSLTEDLLFLEGRPLNDLEDTQKSRDNECSVCLFNRVEVVL